MNAHPSARKSFARFGLSAFAAISLASLAGCASPGTPADAQAKKDFPIAGKGYEARHLAGVKPVPCLCGESYRIFTIKDGPMTNIHVTHIMDSRKHYHKKCTEFYYILEGHGVLEVGDDKIQLSPGLLVRIDPLTPHRGYGDFKTLIIGLPACESDDEYMVKP